MTKRIWLPTACRRRVSCAGRDASGEQMHGVADELGLPLIVKPPHEGSSIGITKVEGRSETMRPASTTGARYDDDVLAEEFISGRRSHLPVLGAGRDARALPVVESWRREGNYDYQHKYFSDDTKYLCPAPLARTLTSSAIQALAVQAYNALGCRGWGARGLHAARPRR